MGYKKRHLDAFLRQSCTFTATFYPVVWDILDWSHQRPSHYINGRNRKSLWLWLLLFSPFFQAESCPVCLSVNIFILEFTKFLFCCFQGFLPKNRKLFHSAPLSLMHLSSSFSASAKSLQRKHPLYFFSSPLSFLHFISPLLLLPSHSWFFSLHFFSLFFHAAVLICGPPPIIPPIVSLLPFCLYRHLLSPSLPSLLYLATCLFVSSAFLSSDLFSSFLSIYPHFIFLSSFVVSFDFSLLVCFLSFHSLTLFFFFYPPAFIVTCFFISSVSCFLYISLYSLVSLYPTPSFLFPCADLHLFVSKSCSSLLWFSIFCIFLLLIPLLSFLFPLHQFSLLAVFSFPSFSSVVSCPFSLSLSLSPCVGGIKVEEEEERKAPTVMNVCILI